MHENEIRKGVVHKGHQHIFPYIWTLPPSCLQLSSLYTIHILRKHDLGFFWPPSPLVIKSKHMARKRNPLFDRDPFPLMICCHVYHVISPWVWFVVIFESSKRPLSACRLHFRNLKLSCFLKSYFIKMRAKTK